MVDIGSLRLISVAMVFIIVCVAVGFSKAGAFRPFSGVAYFGRSLTALQSRARPHA